MKELKEKVVSGCETRLEKENLSLRFLNEGSVLHDITLKAGHEFISKTFFTSEYPTESEIEKALNHIEYEITAHKALKNDKDVLVCANKTLAEILNVSVSSIVTRETVEEAFDKYIDCAYGEPAFLLQIDYSVEKLSIIMLVRSIMYYLGFDKIQIAQ